MPYWAQPKRREEDDFKLELRYEKEMMDYYDERAAPRGLSERLNLYTGTKVKL